MIRPSGTGRYRQCDFCGYGQGTVEGYYLPADWHVCRRGPDKRMWMILWERA